MKILDTCTKCERCGSEFAKKVPSMTAYHRDEKSKEDPNRDLFLCEQCHDEYIEY